MAGSHITKFNTHEDKQPVIADLLIQDDQDYNHEHDTSRGYHNPRDP